MKLHIFLMMILHFAIKLNDAQVRFYSHFCKVHGWLLVRNCHGEYKIKR